MTVLPKKFQIIGLVVLVVVTGYVAGEFIAATRVAALQASIESTIEQQKVTLEALSETTARYGSDEIAKSIVPDCSTMERKEFDALLGRLDAGLPASELNTLDRLFGRCGYYFAQHKSIMVARLEREVTLYKTFVAELETVTGSSKQDIYKIETWNSLLINEKKQSELFMSLVQSQDRIIEALLQGKTTTSGDIQTILTEVKNTQEALTQAGEQAADLRAVLIAKE